MRLVFTLTAGMNVREGRIPFRGYETWYRAVGEGDLAPLLCLHGGPGATHLGQRPLERFAEAGRRVVFYDQLGCGRSSQPSDHSLWTVELFVAEVATVREALGLDRVHLLGSSWGGMLALEVALRGAPGLESLILSSTLPSTRLWVEEAVRLRAELPPEVRRTLEEHETAGTTGDPAYEAAVMDFYHRHVCRLDPWPEIVNELMASLRKEVYETMWGPSEVYPTGTLKDWDVTSRLGEIRVPALVTCGRYDEATPRLAQVIADGITDAELVVFEQSAHIALLEETERYLEIVGGFLDRVDASADLRAV
jgi:proline-specific peptidase